MLNKLIIKNKNKGVVMSDITIDGTEYKKEQMSNEQVAIVNKLANIQQSKNNLLSQIQDLEILADVYVGKFKDAKSSEEVKQEESK
jgi:hypothetical protein